MYWASRNDRRFASGDATERERTETFSFVIQSGEKKLHYIIKEHKLSVRTLTAV